MKKQTKGRKTPPRRKPLGKRAGKHVPGLGSVPGLDPRARWAIAAAERDHARYRAIKEAKQTETFAEWIGLWQREAALTEEEAERLDALGFEYDRTHPNDAIERHLADIRREKADKNKET